MKVYVIGDSISIQYGPYLQRYLQGVMGYARKEGEEEALLNLDNPQGANGGDSGMVLAFLQAIAAAGGIVADVVLVNCGLHDIKTDPQTGAKQVSLERYQENLRGIIQVVAGMGRAMVWVRTTPCDERVHNHAGMAFHRFAADCARYNDAADRIMIEAGVPRIDLHTFTANLGPDLYCDHVHFIEPVREKQAAFIAGWPAEWKEGCGDQP
jgi:lysophospholipase L1-like esterase